MIHAVVNPAGAGGKTMKTWLQAEQILHEKHADYDAHFSSLNRNINDIVSDLSDNDEETRILLFGGDGTMNLAVNAIRDFEKTRIGFVPCGSGNDLAKALKIPKDVNACIEQVMKDEIVRQMDVGELIMHNHYDETGRLISSDDQSRYFNISSGMGFDAEICAHVEASGMKKILNKVHLGKMSYITAALKVIFESKRAQCEMIIDGKENVRFEELMFTAAMNNAYEGGGFMFGPGADPCDGVFDLCAADHLTKFDFFRMFPYAYTGSHVKFDGVYMHRAKDVRCKTDRPLWVHTDGEVLGLSSDITLRISDHKLRMII